MGNNLLYSYIFEGAKALCILYKLTVYIVVLFLPYITKILEVKLKFQNHNCCLISYFNLSPKYIVS